VEATPAEVGAREGGVADEMAQWATSVTDEKPVVPSSVVNVPGVLPTPGHHMPPDWAKAGLFPAARNYVDPEFIAGAKSSRRFAAPGVFGSRVLRVFWEGGVRGGGGLHKGPW